MYKAIATKHADSKASSIVGGVFLFIFFVVAGIIFTFFVYTSYKSKIDLYEMELYYYNAGYNSSLPTKPDEPIAVYVVINLVAVAIGAFFCWLIIHWGDKERAKPNTTIFYDEDNQTLKVFTDSGYTVVPLSSIIKLSVENTSVVPAGKIIVPVSHSYGKIIFKYVEHGTNVKIKSSAMDDVESVKDIIQSLIEREK